MATNGGLHQNVCKWDVMYLESFGQTMITTSRDNPSSFCASNGDSQWQLKVSPIDQLQDDEDNPFLVLQLQSCKYPSQKANIKCDISVNVWNEESCFKKNVNCNSVSVGEDVVICTSKEAKDLKNVSLHMLFIKCTLEVQEWQGEAPSVDSTLTRLEEASIQQSENLQANVEDRPLESSSVETTAEPVKPMAPSAGLLDDLRKLFQCQNFGAVWLVVGKDRILAYKGILSVRSPKFANLFECLGDIDRVEIKDMDYEVLKELILFIYTDEAPNLSMMARRLFPVAATYQLPKLKDMCEKKICSDLSVDTLPTDLLLSLNNDGELLKTKAVEFLKQNKKAVMRTASWKRMARENQNMMGQILFEMFE